MPLNPQSPEPAPSGELGVVLLGASHFPHYPKADHWDNEAFGRSASAIRRLFETGVSVRGTASVLDLFGRELSIRDLSHSIRQFVRSHAAMRDVVIYYCGHGIFLPGSDNSYALMLTTTEPHYESATALRVSDLHSCLELDL